MPLIWRSDPGAPARQADTTCVLPLLSCQVLDVLILLWTSSTVKLEVINIAPDGHLVFFFFWWGRAWDTESHGLPCAEVSG